MPERRHCLHHFEKTAKYPKGDPLYCTLRCAAEDAVDMRSDTTPLEVSTYWCDVCEAWVRQVIDGCEICDRSIHCGACDEYVTPRQGCEHIEPITRKNRAQYGWTPEKQREGV